MRSCMDRLLAGCASNKSLKLNGWSLKPRTHESIEPQVALLALTAIILPHQEGVEVG